MVWGLRPKLFGGQSESVLSSRATTPVPPVVTRQVTEPTSQTQEIESSEPTSKEEVIEAIMKVETSASNENFMDAQSTAQILLEGDIIVPLDEERPKTYADMTNLALKYPDFAEQILALPLPGASDAKPPATQAAHAPATPNKADITNEIDSSTLPRKSRKTSRNDRPTRERGGRWQKNHGGHNLPHKSPKTPLSASPASSLNGRRGSTGIQNMTPVQMRSSAGMHQNTPPQPIHFNPTPTPSLASAGTRPSNSEVDALIDLLQRARTTDPAFQNKTLLEVELELKQGIQGGPQSSPHFPTAPMPLGMQSTNHADFASWGKKPNGEMGYVPNKTFTPPKPQSSYNNAFSNYGRKRSGPGQWGPTTPPSAGYNGSANNNRSGPRGSAGPHRFSNRNTRMSLPATRAGPEPPVRPVWPTSKDEMKQQVLAKSSNNKAGMKRIGPSLDELTSPKTDSVNHHAASVFAIKSN